MQLKLESGGCTDIGLKREHNEDSILVCDELKLYAVADGMGGHAAGEIASATAIEAFKGFIERCLEDSDLTPPFGIKPELSDEENLIRSAVVMANREVARLAEKDQTFGGMGTTIATLYLSGGWAHVGHVGDSRVYLLRVGKLETLTQDHSWVNEQVQRNVISKNEARNHRWRNVITRALGDHEDIEADLTSIEVRPGDLFLLCSDGLTTMVDDDAILQCLAETNNSLEAQCGELVKLANDAGGLDNISVVLIRIQS